MEVYFVYEKSESGGSFLIAVSQTLEAAHDYVKDSYEAPYLIELCEMPVGEVFLLLSQALQVAAPPPTVESSEKPPVLARWIVNEKGELAKCK